MIHAKTAIIEAARSGDKQALSHLLLICQPDLKRFARRTCSTSEDAEDAVQIALWQVYKKIGFLKNVTAFASWLFRIIERECYRLFRGGRSESTSGSFDDITIPVADDALLIDLTRAIAMLPTHYRIVFVLREIEEQSTPEVASQLGLSPEAVKGRLHRARTMLRDYLRNGGYRRTQK